jgi:hypothetical protein
MHAAKTYVGFILLICFSLVPYTGAIAQSTPPHYYHIPATNVGVSNSYFIAPTSLFIFTQSELASMIEPINGPLEISTIWLRHGGETPISSVTLDNFTIRMGHSSLVDAVPNFEDNFNLDAPQVVLSQTSYTYTPLVSNVNNPADGWTPINLDVPFSYNFTDNLCIEFSFDNYDGIVAGNYASIDSWSTTGSPVAQTSFTAGETTATFAGPRPMFGIGTLCQPVTLETSIVSCGSYINELGDVYTASGEYAYTLISPTGCDTSIVLSLNITSPPTVSINESPVGCGGQTEYSINANGSSPFTFAIDSEGILNTTGVFTLTAGTYSLVVTDGSGCETTVEIINNEALTCPEDFDQDFVIGVSDLQLFNAAYGCSNDCCPYDLNDDGAVSVADLLLFISAFGILCE